MCRYQIYEDESAVSSVISVVLLVAIAVILAAVVATFALDIGESTATPAPQASFDIQQETMYVNATGSNYAKFYVVTITQTGGDAIEEGRLSVRVDGERAWGITVDGCGPDCDVKSGLWDGSGTVSAGSSVTVVHGDDPALDDGTPGYTVVTGDSSDPQGGSDNISENILVPTGERTAPTDNHIDLDVGDTVRVVWTSERSDETTVLAEHEVTG
ncbi:type IV pilin N-terminal domain-containing protein [Haloarcula onubensis]|uniref:Type IV pilin N-terminal domain-containing protein n=1 Tax=Haloarcula onubensis TaxID=2950539 RepID=A0ABU2FS30_9EURY|nr:type IV pilin N-terminal domain-containing protein [Halomicroarcula sp. S3CR25-11]MDS0283563.1 type IV pilin N-terminal domain-containing protein [Halomicroarcula sp. S3CR25-11]